VEVVVFEVLELGPRVSEAVYLRDPDGNGVELYRDRPPEEWPLDAEGRLAMGNWRLDIAGLLAEAEP
jgi:catechol 2,3-dioxygenase